MTYIPRSASASGVKPASEAVENPGAEDKLDAQLTQMLRDQGTDRQKRLALTICCQEAFLNKARQAIRSAEGHIEHESPWLDRGMKFLAEITLEAVPILARTPGIERVGLAYQLRGIH